MLGNKTSKRWMRGVVQSHRGDLQRYALRLVGDEDSARDVVQDTFLRLWEIGKIDDPQHLRRWLFVVCRNRCTDVLRKRHRARARDAQTATSVVKDVTAPDVKLERRELAAEVEQQLMTLSPQQREVVRLKVGNGLSYRAIGTELGLSEGNVGVILHRALSTLRKNWSKLRQPPRRDDRIAAATRPDTTVPAIGMRSQPSPHKPLSRSRWSS